MPYYCTVPRCTSMAGKAKNVSFHQFPRDPELARYWNEILKRGKPYTKYSKVCSLHFKPEDYTITNAGHWRTLRKDAIPSRNLPSESPTPYQRKQWTGWNQTPTNVIDPNVQMAQAIYMQTMLAMQTSSSEILNNGHPTQNEEPNPHTSSETEIQKGKETNTEKTYKCSECLKCFKDPDVFLLHKRTHIKHETNEKENFNMNLTLQANPILANLLKTNNDNIFDTNPLTMENILMTALVNIRDGYMRNLTSLIKNNDVDNVENGLDHDQNALGHDENGLGHDENGLGHDGVDNRNNVGHNNHDFGEDGDESAEDNPLRQNQDRYGLKTNLEYELGQNINDHNSDSDSEFDNQNYHTRDELSDTNRGNSDISDIKLYKNSFNDRCNGFDIGHNDIDHDDIDNNDIDNNDIDNDDIDQNDSVTKGSATINAQICDSDLNESLDSDNLVIDENI